MALQKFAVMLNESNKSLVGGPLHLWRGKRKEKRRKNGQRFIKEQ
jgi:hypothetical protein